jgi:hypothetical protein
MACAIKLPDKNPCLNIPTHHWGPVEFCCQHFDLFVQGLLDIRDAIAERRHEDFVNEYNQQTKRTSVIPFAPCNTEKKKEDK